jgi:putative FmdB family regulatory protein
LPIYEYEPEDRECLICEGRVDVIQSVDEEPLKYCPWCGLEVRRIISKPSIQVKSSVNPDKAAERGFVTFRKTDKGVYEKVAGEGPSVLKTDPTE